MRSVNAFCRLACTTVLMLIWLTGCGPGVGGSGTGQESVQALVVFDAKSASVCGTALAQGLQCTATAVADGTATTTFVDRATGGQVTATLQGDTLELDARCQHLRFSGVWGVNSAGLARFYGTVLNDTTGVRVPAQVAVTAVSGGLQVVMLDAAGRELLGPLEMVPPAAVSGSLPACP